MRQPALGQFRLLSLHRVYPPETVEETQECNDALPHSNGSLERENQLLRETVDDLRRRVDSLDAERRELHEKRRRLTALLTGPDLHRPRRRWWWFRALGG